MSYFEVNGLQVRHKTSEGVKEVLNIEHIAIEKGTTYGIVGESGQGKTVLALRFLNCCNARREKSQRAPSCWTAKIYLHTVSIRCSQAFAAKR